MKTGILVHGYNVNAPNWKEVAWRDGSGLLGRLPQAMIIASILKPELVIFGTGASWKDNKVEAEVMRDFLLEHFLELSVLPDFSGVDLKEMRNRIVKISRLEIKSNNTSEEIKYASRMFREAGVNIIGSISSPDHVSRCAANADEIFTEDKELAVFKGRYFAWQSQVPYGVKDKWPVVVESPHRLYPYIKRLLSLPKEEQEEVIKRASG